MLNNKVILITGGTGSFGRMFVRTVLERYRPEKLIVFSRDEFKQHEMAALFPLDKYPSIRFFLGDVRDRARLFRAFEGVDYVVHAAALKQVPALEYNPMEAVKTNVIGADNIVEASIDAGVKKVVVLSTDKAVSPANLYGATKLVAEKIFVAANAYAGGRVKFSVVRYGNVIGSRGSVIPLFLKLAKEKVKKFPITDQRMTRFWISLEQGVELVLNALAGSEGGEIFIPRIPSMKITELARAVCPGCSFNTIGIRPGEKLHETLISEDEGRSTKVLKDYFVILPQFFESPRVHAKYRKLSGVEDGFVYRSDTNDHWLEGEALAQVIRGMKVA